MKEYHKIQSLYKRDEKGRLLIGDYSLPEFAYLKNNEWVFTEKVDGTNLRIVWHEGTITFGGKTDNAHMSTQLGNALNAQFLPLAEQFAIVFGEAPVCLYGEGYGAKIQQGGGNYRSDPGFVLFDVLIDGWWLQRPHMLEIAQRLSLDVVPLIGVGDLDDMESQVKEGFSSRWGDFPAEGIVARPTTELRTRGGDRLIVKLKHRDFERAVHP